VLPTIWFLEFKEEDSGGEVVDVMDSEAGKGLGELMAQNLCVCVSEWFELILSR
jgi:hypothetical protein